MSKTPPAATNSAPVPDFKFGDIVTSKIRGFPPWPSEIFDPEAAPRTVKKEKPKGNSSFCVRFFPLGDFGWIVGKDITPLTPEGIDAAIEKGIKNASLLKGYQTAKDPAEWLKEKNVALAAQKEKEENAPVDELDGEDDESGKKGKKRKRDAGSRKKSDKGDKEASSTKKRTTKGRKGAKDADSDDDGAKPKTKRQKKGGDDEEDDQFANDPEATKIKDWRHQLQRAFLRENVKPEAAALPEYHQIFTTIEDYQGLTIEYLSYSKIGKVMKKISQLPASHIPEDDAEYKFRDRATSLVGKWQQILNARAEASNVNGHESAAAAGDTSVLEGDVTMNADA